MLIIQYSVKPLNFLSCRSFDYLITVTKFYLNRLIMIKEFSKFTSLINMIRISMKSGPCKAQSLGRSINTCLSLNWNLKCHVHTSP